MCWKANVQRLASRRFCWRFLSKMAQLTCFLFGRPRPFSPHAAPFSFSAGLITLLQEVGTLFFIKWMRRGPRGQHEKFPIFHAGLWLLFSSILCILGGGVDKLLQVSQNLAH